MNAETHKGCPWRLLRWSLVLLLLPGIAAAATLVCNPNGTIQSGALFEYQGACNGVTGIANVFSGLSCDFQYILDVIMSRTYCGISANMKPVVSALLILYVVIYGLMALMGLAQINGKEVVTHMIKMALVATFALNAAFGVSFVYALFLGAINDGVGWALSVVMPTQGGCVPGGVFASGWSEMNIFKFLDCMLVNQLLAPFTGNGAKLFGLMAVLSYALPPVFAMFMYFATRTITLLIRVVLTYLLGLSAIAFLVALGPIFISCALYKVTYHFFESWLRYLISFVLQIVLVFCVFGVWLFMMNIFTQFFGNIVNIIVPYQHTWWTNENRKMVSIWGLCDYQMTPSGLYGTFYTLGCVPGGRVIAPTELVQESWFVYYLIVNLGALSIVVYAFDALMKNVASMATQLSGPKYAPMLAAGGARGAGEFGGFKGARSMADKAQSGFSDTVGGVFDKIGGGAKSGMQELGQRVAKEMGLKPSSDAQGGFADQTNTQISRR